MVHLRPLPGSPTGGDLETALEAARADAEILTSAGVDGMVVENFGDVPFAKGRVPPSTVAAMAIVCRELRRDHNVPFGVNVLRNDAEAALSVAAVTGADFVRVNVHVGAAVTDQGVIEGRARETLLLRRALGSSALLFADVRVKHARPLGAPGEEDDLVGEARDARRRGLADVLVLSGVATGARADPADFRRVREALPDTPLFVGSGITAGNLEEFWTVSDGMIVGSALKRDGDPRLPVDRGRAREVLEAAARLRRVRQQA
jgi:membrane complex biogenesis BtpA family protein